MARLARFVPADGRLPVTGGAEDEALHALDLAPYPDGLARTLLTEDLVGPDLERLAGLQQPDGGWVVDSNSVSPAAVLEWRGYATVNAVVTLQRYGAG